MNIQKLKTAEKLFLLKYPGGFSNPEMEAISRKHKLEKMHSKALEYFAPENFSDPEFIVESMVKLVGSSSMVSVFEKPRFRDFIRSMSEDERNVLARGLYELLHGSQEGGFDMILDILSMDKLAKWTLITIIPAYYRPQKEVFIKPTTTKNVITNFDIENLVYKPTPSYQFYSAYRDIINMMKKEVDPGLSPGNAAFCGFLMMSMEN